jgi:hypothetical protein
LAVWIIVRIFAALIQKSNHYGTQVKQNQERISDNGQQREATTKAGLKNALPMPRLC